MCFIVFIIHSAMLYGHFLFLEQEYSGTKNHCKEWQFSFSIFVKETKNSCNSYQLRIDLDFLVLHRWLAFVFWFHKLACIRVNLAGKKQGKHKVCQIKPALATTKVWGESEYYLDLENKETIWEVNPFKLWTFAKSTCIQKFAFNLSIRLIL